MKDFTKHIIEQSATVKKALERLNQLGANLTLFVIDDRQKLIGTLTDGDIRRGLVNGLQLTDSVANWMFTRFRYLQRNNYDLSVLDELRVRNIRLLPLVDDEFKIIRIINFAEKKSILPVDAVVMAGGRGERLKPLTDYVPKSLLKVGNKPIIEHNIDRLIDYGVDNIYLTINYLGQQLVEYFQDGSVKGVNIRYTHEHVPLGTIGALSLIEDFPHDYVLLMNSDLLTNIDFEDFFREFLNKDADMAVATIPYYVNIPYGVLETNNERIVSFREKPTYTYYASAGIYLIKKRVLSFIPNNEFYNATDLMETLIHQNAKLIYYPLLGYWLDIGRHEDYKKALEDVRHIKF